jgi:hypothetical protein
MHTQSDRITWCEALKVTPNQGIEFLVSEAKYLGERLDWLIQELEYLKNLLKAPHDGEYGAISHQDEQTPTPNNSPV